MIYLLPSQRARARRDELGRDPDQFNKHKPKTDKQQWFQMDVTIHENKNDDLSWWLLAPVQALFVKVVNFMKLKNVKKKTEISFGLVYHVLYSVMPALCSNDHFFVAVLIFCCPMEFHKRWLHNVLLGIVNKRSLRIQNQ